ncbi:MAG: hypothetical protein KDJ88_03870 [Bauldia sp.]|nr:hypothetical protein [Bauldia sp.]
MLSDHELSRVIDLLHKVRRPFDAAIPGARPDPYWNLVLELVECHLRRRPLSKTTLIKRSQTSYSTGYRLIAKMIEDGSIIRVPRGPHHKTTLLAPSPEFVESFANYAEGLKARLASLA